VVPPLPVVPPVAGVPHACAQVFAFGVVEPHMHLSKQFEHPSHWPLEQDELALEPSSSPQPTTAASQATLPIANQRLNIVPLFQRAAEPTACS